MDFKYMEEHGMIDPSYASEMKELGELFEKELSMFNSDEEYLDWLNENMTKNDIFKHRPMTLEERNKFARHSDNMKVKSNEKPEPFFYCNVGGIAPICSDCKRNHLNAIFRTEDIENWYSPQHSANFKICEGYIFNKK